MNKSLEELTMEVRALIAHANQYLAPLKLQIRIVDYQIFLPGEEDPIKKQAMQETAWRDAQHWSFPLGGIRKRQV